MACLLAKMIEIATIKRPSAFSSTVKRPHPSLPISLALLFVFPLRAWQRLLDSPAVASRINQNVTTATEALMTASLTLVFTTRK
jgi:hypothetical protein